jgi:2-dehydro-3-deoxyphosphogluconate aldolase / (4S)-4-hydroxy-2-oxoglutarate aldolase
MDTTKSDEVLRLLGVQRLVAVVRAPSVDAAIAVADALEAGGIAAIEVTFSTPGAPEAIRELAGRPGLVVGAGTVTTLGQAEDALRSGARFLVSPHTDLAIVAMGIENGVLTVPGALTPTEVVTAAALVPLVKLFPGSVGGPGYLRALRAPFPDLRLMPTGGVSADNARDWLDAGAFALGAGGELCPKDVIAAGNFEEITRRAQRYSSTVQQWVAERQEVER